MANETKPTINATQLLSLPARIEAILYLKGKPIALSEMAEIANETESSVHQALIALMASYAQRDTALSLFEQNGKYSLE